MDLLTKFAAVEIRPETRISGPDRIFCQAHQAAYEAALNTLKELEYFWDDMLAAQREALAPINISAEFYLTSPDCLSVSGKAIKEQYRSLHALFTGQLVSYFNSAYHLAIPEEEMQECLLPQKPADRRAENYKEQAAEYGAAMDRLCLHYSQILEQIFLRTDGRELAEQALYELKEKCCHAAWISSSGKARFTLKKNILQLEGCACSYRDWYGGRSSWNLSDWTLDILKGIAHFESGGFSEPPVSLDMIIQRNSLDYSQHVFSGCKKVQSLKLFKNRRVDIKFCTESDARTFLEEYLGTMPPCE